MSKATLSDVRNEQTAKARKTALERLYGFERDSKFYVDNRQRLIDTTEQQITKLQERLALEQANLAEITKNRTEYLAQLEEIAAKDVISIADTQVAAEGYYDLGATAAEREARKAALRDPYKMLASVNLDSRFIYKVKGR